MTGAVLFSVVNVTVGFVVSWLLAHYVLPLFFNTKRNFKRSTMISFIYTVAALIRNVVIYWGWVNV